MVEMMGGQDKLPRLIGELSLGIADGDEDAAFYVIAGAAATYKLLQIQHDIDQGNINPNS